VGLLTANSLLASISPLPPLRPNKLMEWSPPPETASICQSRVALRDNDLNERDDRHEADNNWD